MEMSTAQPLVEEEPLTALKKRSYIVYYYDNKVHFTFKTLMDSLNRRKKNEEIKCGSRN